MTLPEGHIDSRRPATLTVYVEGTSVDVAPGAWEVLTVEDGLGAGEACAGIGGREVTVALDGVDVPDSPKGRIGAGLGVVLGCLDDMPDLKVLDVVVLGLRGPQPSLLRTLLSNARTRAMHTDQAAAARALAGRTGLARWVDRPAADLPAEVAALTDTTRVLAGVPRAVIWCRPDWLNELQQAQIAEAIRTEQSILGFPVLELRTLASAHAPAPSTLPEP